MKKIMVLTFCLAFVLLLASCDKLIEQETSENNSSEEADSNMITYEQITGEEAKILIDTESGYIILDVRTPEEFADGHILNAVNIDYKEIGKRYVELPDKNQLILVYCRSGRRSKIAAETLVSLGYTNVKEFGGIINWNYGTVK